MSFQQIRAHIETKVNDAYQALSPAIPVCFDNTSQTPPPLPYVVCLISYTDTVSPTVSPTDGAVEQINGNLQLSIYSERAQGMKKLEELGAEALITTAYSSQQMGHRLVFAPLTLECPVLQILAR